jgi:radical SAM superfamily enzyme YgiQ (UPF0313 family)
MEKSTVSEPIKVGLVQINNSFSNQNYLPLSVGMLQAYAQAFLKQPDRFQFMLPLYKRVPVQHAVEELQYADLVLISVYVWNFRISLKIAEALKSRRSETVIVFGGPHVPERDDTFLKRYPFIDIACHGEGEQVALAVLENFTARNWSQVPSISYFDQSGAVIKNPRAGRVKDLSVFPSPYLTGVFDPLMDANPSEHWIALWETNRGCPFACTFCDWGSAVASKVYGFDIERIYKEVEWFSNRKIEFVFCCDANFGILSRDVDIASYVAESKRKTGFPQALSVQATKNATERAYKTQKILADAGLNKGVDIALQSMDPNTLKSIKRGNISTATYQELQRRFIQDKVDTYTDLILGLPGETYDTFSHAVMTIIENGQHNRIQFNNLSILPNAEMGDPNYQKEYGMVTVESRTINIHGSLVESPDEVFETQLLVVGTKTMPRPEWVRTRAFSWMAAFLYFDKVLQIPLTLIHEICQVSYKELFELFSESTHDEFPILASIRAFFLEKAQEIQQGGAEYCRSSEWLNIWWPADEYVLIKLCYEDKLAAFFSEAEEMLNQALIKRHVALPENLLHESMELNRSLIKRPFQTEDVEVTVSYNIWEYYRAVITGQQIPLEPKAVKHHIDRTSKTWDSWDLWCQEVIWYGNKRGAYLYGNNVVEPQLSGHF